MSADEVVESTLSAAHCNDFGAFLDKAIGYCSADARCSTNHEDMFVLERHLRDLVFCRWRNEGLISDVARDVCSKT